MKPTTAILVFAQSSAQEALRKPFVGASQLFERLNEQTLRTVKRSGLPYVIVSEEEQRGNTFGERYLNAIEEVFSRGYDRIITIGNDTPQLTAAHLQRAAKQLDKETIVFGPSADGGYYLLGMHRSQYHRSQMEQLPWQTTSLLRTITSLFETHGASVSMLNRLHDLDLLRDVYYFLHTFRPLARALKQLLMLLFGTLQTNTECCCHLTTQLFFKKPLNKGSPVVIY